MIDEAGQLSGLSRTAFIELNAGASQAPRARPRECELALRRQVRFNTRVFGLLFDPWLGLSRQEGGEISPFSVIRNTREIQF